MQLLRMDLLIPPALIGTQLEPQPNIYIKKKSTSAGHLHHNSLMISISSCHIPNPPAPATPLGCCQ